MNFNFTLNPRHWFQKRTPALAAGWAESRNRMRYNALFMLDPDVLVRNLGMFAAGDIAGMERILEEFEARDDKMKVGSFKMAAAVASKPWEVRIAKGEEDNPAAKRHQEVLTRFWNRITVTDAFCRNRRGGLRTLVKQMMGAQSRVYAVHDVSWAVRPDGELEATFTQVPAWNFENRTGELRYLKDPGAYTGVEMKDGEWLVTVGEGVGVTAAILAMAKRLSWNDWLLFSEKCGMPVILGNTGAKEDTPAWNALMAAIKAIAPKTGLLADVESKIQAVPFGGSSGTVTYKELVETVDRAISSLYRGGDLATMSKGGDGVGTNAQDGESELMDADGCAMVSETLNRQIERHVVRFTCGDFEPLAGIVLNPPAETEDVDREIKIDMHLAGLGVKLSKADALARYGRTEAEADDDALELAQNAPQNGLPGGFGGFPNEDAPATPLQNAVKGLQNAPGGLDAQRDGNPADASEGVLGAFARDTSKAAEAVRGLLDDPTPEKAKALIDDLPNLVPEDPALAAVIAEEMAKEFAVTFPNETPADKAPRSGELKRHNGADEAAAVAHPGHDGLKRYGGVGGTALANELAKDKILIWLANDDREKNGTFAEKGTGDKTQGAAGNDAESDDPEKLPKSSGGYKDMADFHQHVAAVTKEKIDDVVNGDRKGLIPPHLGYAIVMSDPVFEDQWHRKMKFDSCVIPKYESGQTRSFNVNDIDRFKYVQDAIYAVRHQTKSEIVLGQKFLGSPAFPPRGAQRLYHTPTNGGTLWAFSWADKTYIKAFHKRPNGDLPYHGK